MIKLYYPSEISSCLDTSYKNVKGWMDEGYLAFHVDKKGNRCCDISQIKEFADKNNIEYEMPKILSSKDVAGIYGVTERTVIRWEQSGKLNPRKKPSGRKYYYLQDIIDATNKGLLPAIKNLPTQGIILNPTSNETSDTVLSNIELAHIYGISERTVSTWKKKDILK